MNIRNHAVWKDVASLKKPGHLLRIYLARQYAKLFPRSKYIGITGSVGKTTTTAALKLVLGQKYKVLSTKPNLDPIFNLPITILRTRKATDKVVLEMGVEYPGEMDFYLSLVRPATAIITRIAIQHSEFLGNLEQITVEKGKLVKQLPSNGLAVLNYDDVNVRKMADVTEAKVLFFGQDPQNCQIWAGNIKIEQLSTSFEINYGVERVRVNSKLLGEHQIYSNLAAAAVGVSLGIPLTSIKKALEKLEPEEHRLQSILGFNGSVILDDTYNSAPISVEAALNTLQQITARRRILVLGEMKELGDYSEKLHREIARKIYKEKIDLVFLGTGGANIVSDELKSLGFLPEKLEANLQNPQIVSKLLKVLRPGDVCLVKGARAVRLDEVIRRIIKK